MPLVALALAKIAHMEDIETLGLLFLGSCPGGTFSNIATYWAKGDLGLRYVRGAFRSFLMNFT